MIVEKSTFELDVNATEEAVEAPTPPMRGRGRGQGRGHGRGQRGRGRGARGKRGGVGYAVQRGQKRGTHCGTHDVIVPIDEPSIITSDAPGEGLYSYIQTTICRRTILTRIFGNATPDISVAMCCDLCNPELFNQTRPSKPIAVSRQQNIKKGAPVEFVRDAWRRVVKRQFYPRALWAPHAILDDATCELLSSVGPIKTHERLASILKSGWARWDELGEGLFQMISKLEIPPVSATTKRAGNTANTSKTCAVPSTDTSNSSSVLAGPSEHPATKVTKRARTSVQFPGPKPFVISWPPSHNPSPTPYSTLTIPAQVSLSTNIESSMAMPSVPDTSTSSLQSTHSFPLSTYDEFFANLRRS